MKKLLLLVALALVGCDDTPDQYAMKRTLMPEEVVNLQNVCKSQPNYDTSWIKTRDGEAKGVVCRYRDTEYRVGRGTYTIDAEILQIKIQEKIK